MIRLSLVLMNKEKNKSYIEEIFKTYNGKLLRFSLKFFKDEENAKDHLANMYAEMLNKIENGTADFPNLQTCKNYFYTLTKNRYFDICKRNKINNIPFEDLSDLDQERIVNIASCDIKLEEKDSLKILEYIACVAKLTKRQMDVFNLMKTNCTNIEISETLNISVKCTNDEIYEVRKRLKTTGLLNKLK